MIYFFGVCVPACWLSFDQHVLCIYECHEYNQNDDSSTKSCEKHKFSSSQWIDNIFWWLKQQFRSQTTWILCLEKSRSFFLLLLLFPLQCSCIINTENFLTALYSACKSVYVYVDCICMGLCGCLDVWVSIWVLKSMWWQGIRAHFFYNRTKKSQRKIRVD